MSIATRLRSLHRQQGDVERRLRALELLRPEDGIDYAAKVDEFERYFQMAHVLVDPTTDPGGKRPPPDGCPPPPTPRWWPARLGPQQHGFLHSKAELNLTAAGRRVFKSEAAVRRAIRFAITTKIPRARGFLCAPTQQQAEEIWLQTVLDLIPPWALHPHNPINMTARAIRFWNGSRIRIAGLDQPSRIEGGNWDFGCVTEYGDCKPNIYQAKIEPMVVNIAQGAYCDIEGVPEGRNHYFQLKESIVERVAAGAKHQAYWHWTTVSHLHLYLGREVAARKIENARASTDPMLFRQEYEGDWVTFAGRAYHQFDREIHAALPLRYNPDLPLIFCFDFNTKPGVAAVVQELFVDGHPRLEPGWYTCVIGEVWIPENSNTQKVARRLRQDWEPVHRGEVLLYGDATGGRQTSSSLDGGDWTLVRNELLPWLDGKDGRPPRMRFCVGKSNPHERDRLNAVNLHLRSASDRIRMLVCPINAPRVVEDFDGVRIIDAGPKRGRIDKKSDPLLTHLSDAVGYYVADRYPVPKEDAADYDDVARMT